MNLKDEQYFGTLKQWKQKMMKSGTCGDAVFLQQASLHLENDIMVIPAFRESTENKTLDYTVSELKIELFPSHCFCSTSQTPTLSPLTIRVYVKSQMTTFCLQET